MTIDMPTHVSDPTLRADVGVIGGSGFATFLDETQPVHVYTPFGEPSGPVLVGEADGRRVAFLARHGAGHRLPPHRINYRANLWALRAVGVRQVLAASAVGSLRPDLPVGSLVVPDQLVDRTSGRSATYYERDGGVVHVAFADPYSPSERAALLGGDDGAVDGGTLVVIGGPRFSTRAESRWYRAAGGDLVGMTGMPEAVLARELALGYGLVTLVTDLDAGANPDEAVTHRAVFDVFDEHMPRLKALVAGAVARLRIEPDDETATCPARRALDGLDLPFDLPS